MAKNMLIGREIWARIESNTGNKTVAIIVMKIWQDLGGARNYTSF
jgi:hypothetical protein